MSHKTQVFVDPDGDHFRTRLTHTIEVARVARSMAESLDLNAQLAEAVALAHDLGHTPFGHAGEEALDKLMSPYGGFEHNAQSVRILTEIEKSYVDFNGLNLTWESLEGIAKHNGPVACNIPFALAEYNDRHDLDLPSYPSAEAQVAAAADDIAYICHDLQDGLRAQLFSAGDLVCLPVVGPAYRTVQRDSIGADGERIDQAALRLVFATLARDVIGTSQGLLAEADPRSVDDIRNLGSGVIALSDSLCQELKVVRSFLHKNMYRPDDMETERDQAKQMIVDLFNHFRNDFEALPEDWRGNAESASSESAKVRIVADYIAGMTDKFAINHHRKIFGGRRGYQCSSVP